MELSRVLEPEVMESLEEAIDYDEMDHEQVNCQFVEDLLRQEVTGDVLDLGTGTARIPIRLCEARDGIRVTAIDLSTHMLDVARNNVELAGLVDRIRLDRVDSKQTAFEDSAFDVVMSNSLLHHLADPLPAMREAVRLLKPGGRLFFRDLIRPSSVNHLRELVQMYAGDESEHAREMFADSLRAALTLAEMRQLVARCGCDPQTCQASSDRHWTWSTDG